MRYNRVCVIGTPYNLLFNLLIASDAELDNTYYFIQDTLPDSITQNLGEKNVIKLPVTLTKIQWLYYTIKYRYLSIICCPFLNKVRIYAQDHLHFSPIIIGRRNYIYTEDGPNCLELFEKVDSVKKQWDKHLSKNIIQKLYSKLFNPLDGEIAGHNKMCKEVWLSGNAGLKIPKYISGKKIHIVNLQLIWNTLSTFKKNFIYKVFNISSKDTDILKHKKIILLTQPFYDYGFLTLEEHIDIYKKILTHYDENLVVIKTHPRDTINYQQYFPNIHLFNKIVPFQLLLLSGIKFEKAATVFSSSVYGLQNTISVDWYGTKIHPKIEKAFGDIKYKANQQ